MIKLKPKSLPKFLSLATAVFAFALLAAGCAGTSTSAPDTGQPDDRGRMLFVEKCGTCHKMAQAATNGVQGPDLDLAFAPSREVGMDDDTIKGIVRAQVERPYPADENFSGISMPANIVTGNDLEDVAAYVAKYAGVPGAEPPQSGASSPGAQLFADNGCGSCHVLAAADAGGAVGPDLDEVLPEMSKADVKEAIVDPDATVPSGYSAGVMPSFADKLSGQELNQLVKFLISSAGSGD